MTGGMYVLWVGIRGWGGGSMGAVIIGCVVYGIQYHAPPTQLNTIDNTTHYHGPHTTPPPNT